MTSSSNFYSSNRGTVPLLTPLREIELSRLVQAGLAEGAEPYEVVIGLRAEKEFAEANIKLVASIARQNLKRAGKLDLDELIQFGMLGLMRAIRKFDSTRGYRFSTYAYRWISQAISRGITEHSRTIRLPSHVHEELWKIKEIIAEHQKNNSTEKLTDEVMAKKVGMPVARYVQLRRVWADASTSDISEFEGLCFESEYGANYVEDDLREKKKEILSLLIDQLPEREKDIITSRYGFYTGEPETLQSIADRLNLSKERVRQIQSDLTRKFRSFLAG